MWCQMIGIILLKLLQKFHQDPTSETLSKLHLSSKSLPGVLEDMEVPEEPGYGVIYEGASIGSFCESYIKIQLQEPCQDSTCPLSLFPESWRTWRFLMNLEMVSDRREQTLEASVKFSSRLTIWNPVKTPTVL